MVSLLLCCIRIVEAGARVVRWESEANSLVEPFASVKSPVLADEGSVCGVRDSRRKDPKPSSMAPAEKTAFSKSIGDSRPAVEAFELAEAEPSPASFAPMVNTELVAPTTSATSWLAGVAAVLLPRRRKFLIAA